VILIDTNTLDMAPQMYLYDQLNRFIDELPPNQPLAIYHRWGDYTLLLQDFTADHELLHKAVRKAIPRLRIPGHATYSDIDTLKQILSYVRTLPQRKNVLWFNGGSNAFLRPPPSDDSNLETEGEREFINQLRDVYDELEAARVSLYPVDARGMVNIGPDPDQNRTRFEQHSVSSDMAQATGGRAYYNDNGLRQIAAQVIADDASYYTLTYSPDNLHLDNKWHKIRVKVEGQSYELSYRQGYFDDDVNGKPKPSNHEPSFTRTARPKTCPTIRMNRLSFRRGYCLRKICRPRWWGKSLIRQSEHPGAAKRRTPFTTRFPSALLFRALMGETEPCRLARR
jgi:VWFA-related protein